MAAIQNLDLQYNPPPCQEPFLLESVKLTQQPNNKKIVIKKKIETWVIHKANTWKLLYQLSAHILFPWAFQHLKLSLWFVPGYPVLLISVATCLLKVCAHFQLNEIFLLQWHLLPANRVKTPTKQCRWAVSLRRLLRLKGSIHSAGNDTSHKTKYNTGGKFLAKGGCRKCCASCTDGGNPGSEAKLIWSPSLTPGGEQKALITIQLLWPKAAMQLMPGTKTHTTTEKFCFELMQVFLREFMEEREALIWQKGTEASLPS